VKAVKSSMCDQILSGDHKILHCPACGAEYSGNAGDYWNLPDDHVFYCECGEEMELVIKSVTIKYI